MAFQATVYNVMVASPSDIAEERDTVQATIAEWNSVHSGRSKAVLVPIRWEEDATPETGAHPQEIINNRLLKRAGLLVAIFGSRLGTPTNDYDSGSVEEINRHVGAGKPAMLYFSKRQVDPDSIDTGQLDKLRRFKEQLRQQALLGEFTDTAGLRHRFYQDLEKMIETHEHFQSAALAESQRIPSNAVPLLSDDARRLLIASELEGSVQCIRNVGWVSIQAGGEIFGEQNPQSVAEWLAVVEELESAGFLKDRAGEEELYFVTHQGFKMINELKSAEKQEDGAASPSVAGQKEREMQRRFAELLGEQGYNRLRKAVVALGTEAVEFLRTEKEIEDRIVELQAGPIFEDPVLRAAELISQAELKEWHDEEVKLFRIP